MWYVAVFVASFVIDVIPFFSPPAWTAMLLLMSKFDLNPWLVLAAGVPGSTLGRYVLALYIPRFSSHVMKRHKAEELHFVGKRLGQKTWSCGLFVLIYSLLPLSTTALFLAAGIARVSTLKILPPFFVGKFVSDALVLFGGHYAITNAADILHGALSLKSISLMVLGLLLVAAILFIDWRTVLQKKKLRFNFKIWK